MRKDDVAEGEQTQIGARVERGVYAAFRQWVKDDNGGPGDTEVGADSDGQGRGVQVGSTRDTPYTE